MTDSIASIREEARKKGGEELVSKLDAALDGVRDLTTTLDDRIINAQAKPEGDERTMALVAITEALSMAYARAAVAYGKTNNVDNSQIMVLSIRSLVASIQTAIDDQQATANDVLGLIKAADQKMKGDK